MKTINDWMVKIEDFLSNKNNHLKLIDFIDQYSILIAMLIILFLVGQTLIKN